VRHIRVACAIIEKDGKVLSTQRSDSMSMPLKWEFPGGKIDPGESPVECLHREIAEEIGITVDVKRALPPHMHRYDTFMVTLYPFVCNVASGEIVLHEHAASTWLRPEELGTLVWVDADPPIIDAYRRVLKR
jgi:8-oxo-dGTP diphosphatase